jgi:hypothetical protein
MWAASVKKFKINVATFWRISHMNYPRLVRFTASLVMALVMASSGWAQQTSTTAVSATPVPHLVSYSGILKDGSGKAVTGITGVTFLLYRDAEGGVPVWNGNAERLA